MLESPRSLGGAAKFSEKLEFSRPRAVVEAPASPRASRPSGSFFRGRRRWAVLLAGALALLASVAILSALFVRPSPTATLRLELGAPTLEVHAREDDGTVATLGSRRATFRNGVAMIQLDPATVAAGENVFTLHVGSESHSVRVAAPVVAYLDEDALTEDPPRLGLVIRTAPLTQLIVDGVAIRTDATGTARAGSPARLDGGVDEHVAVVVARLPDGEHSLRVLLRAEPASLELRQPPSGFVTDRTVVELVATVAVNAKAYLDGRELANDGGRIMSPLTLSREGDFRFRFDVVEPRRRRRSEQLFVRRVANLAEAAATFQANDAVTYALMRDGPADRVGAPARVRGTVAHVRIEAGRSYLEIHTEPCPAGDGCPLWVEYPAATLAHVDDTVTASGHYRGLVDYRTTGAEARRGPSIEAAFVTVDGR